MPAPDESTPPAPAVATTPFLLRALALSVDLAVVALLASAVVALAGASLVTPRPATFRAVLLLTSSLAGALLFVPPVFWLAYATIFAACGGQTIGRFLLRLRLEDAAGGPLPWGRAFLRAVGQFASALPLVAGFLWVLVDREGRAWHDHLALSRVVAVEKSLDKGPAFQ